MEKYEARSGGCFCFQCVRTQEVGTLCNIYILYNHVSLYHALHRSVAVVVVVVVVTVVLTYVVWVVCCLLAGSLGQCVVLSGRDRRTPKVCAFSLFFPLLLLLVKCAAIDIIV